SATHLCIQIPLEPITLLSVPPPSTGTLQVATTLHLGVTLSTPTMSVITILLSGTCRSTETRVASITPPLAISPFSITQAVTTTPLLVITLSTRTSQALITLL